MGLRPKVSTDPYAGSASSMHWFQILSFVVLRLYVLALALFVARVAAQHHDSAVAADDLAVIADLLDAGLYLHVGSLVSLSSYSRGAVSRYFSATCYL